MNILKRCLAVLPMTASLVQETYDQAQWMTTKDQMRKAIRDLCLSHELLRAERDGLQLMYDELDRKVQHGCANHNCKECDR